MFDRPSRGADGLFGLCAPKGLTPTMLVLCRREKETIIVGDGPTKITIAVTKLEDGKVHIGIDAPRNVVIVRGELLERTQQTKEEHDA